jgi:hypothetical protein
MTDVIERHDREAPEVVSRRGRRRATSLGIAAVLMVTILVWWFIGGTRLQAAGMNHGLPVPLGQDTSFGIVARTDDGGRVRLDSVSATVSAGATITWSVYQAAPGDESFLAWLGPLAPKWPTVPVAGYERVSTGNGMVNGGTWIVGTLHAEKPGVYRVQDVVINYHSGWRSRTANGQMIACVLVYPVGSTFESLAGAGDPLVDQYNRCSDQP